MQKHRVYLKTPNAPGQRAFLRCAASFFLEIRQYSCEKMSCATQKSLAAGHIMSFQIHPKNSRSQSWIKLETSRRIRSCRNAPAKGNFYRRLFDYIVMTNCQLSLAKGCKVEKKLWVQRKTVYYCKIVLQYAENGLEVVLTFRDDLFSCLQRLCGCAYILGQTTANWIWTTIN